jgi:protein-tyrosine-phosphatase
MNILFVCSGNIMRSVISECVLRERARTLLGESGGILNIESCGLEAQPDVPPHHDAILALEHLGVPVCDSGASPADREHMRRCDLAITMTRQQSYVMANRFPADMKKYFSLIEINGAIETVLERRGVGIDSSDWVKLVGRMSPDDLDRRLRNAAAFLTSQSRILMKPLAGVPLNIYELLTLFSPCYHHVSGVHDPIGGATADKFKCADLLDREVTLLLRGLLALACTLAID